MSEQIKKVLQQVKEQQLPLDVAYNRVNEEVLIEKNKHIEGVQRANCYIEATKRAAVEKLGITTEKLTETADALFKAGWTPKKP